MRLPAKSLITVLVLIATSLIALPAAQSAEYYTAETKYWVDCATGFRNIDCIETVEFSDPVSEKRDANGFLDYSSIVWKKANVSTNPKFIYKSVPPESAWTQQEFGIPCIGTRPDYRDGYHNDACYTASGLNPDGSDIIFHLMFGGSGEGFNIYQWVDQGIVRNWNREDGWSAKTVPDGSTWRVTIKSNSVGQNAGVITSNMKNPNITVAKGSDGILRTVILGSVYPNQFNCKIPGQNYNPNSERDNCKHPESYAETASQGFTISISPYIYQFEKLKGFTPGGIFVSGSTGALGQVQYDQDQGIITVPMSGPHFLMDQKTLNKGWMETAVKGEVIRKAFSLDPAQAGNIVKVEISEGDGKEEIATYTSRYLKALDVFEIRAYNFGFSNPVLKVRLKPTTAQTSVSAAKPATSMGGPQGKRMSTIMCVKGKDSRRITAFNPKCPKSWRKK
jgi:hypothetical protein